MPIPPGSRSVLRSLVRGGRAMEQMCYQNVSRGSSQLLLNRCFSGSVNIDSSTPDHVKVMRQRMADSESAAGVWESLWQDGQTPWDLGGPTKVLITEVKTKLEAAKPWTPQQTLVPGCGSGYDLVALARTCDEMGYKGARVIGLDISTTSLKRAQQVVQESIEKDGPFQTQIDLYEGDFFAAPSTWTLVSEPAAEMPALAADETFDFVFDYTFFCALPPELRGEWGRQMAELVDKERGQLLTLMFPYVTKKPKEVRGPPFLIMFDDYCQALNDRGLQIQTPEPYTNDDTHPNRQGQEVIGWWKHGAEGSMTASKL